MVGPVRLYHLILALAGVSGLSACSSPDPAPPPHRTELDLAVLGFEPLATIEAKGIEVQRVDASLELLYNPSVEIRRYPNGEVWLKLFNFGHERRARLTQGQWYALQAPLRRALVPRDPTKERQAFATNRQLDCHDWQTIEASVRGLRGSRFSNNCLELADRAPMTYVAMVEVVVLDAVPDCKSFTKDMRGFAECIRSLGPPTAEHMRLRDEWRNERAR